MGQPNESGLWIPTESSVSSQPVIREGMSIFFDSVTDEDVESVITEVLDREDFGSYRRGCA